MDLAVLLEEMGRACLPGPFFTTVVLGGYTIMEAGNETQKAELLPKISSGELIITLAYAEPGGDNPEMQATAAKSKEASYVIDGTKFFVPDAHISHYLISLAKTEDTQPSEKGMTLFLLESSKTGLEIALLDTIARDKQCEVKFNGVVVDSKDILGELGQGWKYFENTMKIAAIAKCAEMVGGAQQVLEMTVDYAKERMQFGVHIGSFQAIQHHCANMLVDVDAARLITYEAASMLDQGMACDNEIAMAKAWTSEAFRRVTLLGHQVQGGIGFMEDSDLPLYTRRAKASEVAFGDAAFWKEKVAKGLGL